MSGRATTSASTNPPTPTNPPSAPAPAVDWPKLAAQLRLTARASCAVGRAGPFTAGLTGRGRQTWLGIVVANPARRRWTLTRRWEPQARAPRRPDPRTVKFADLRLTERYVGAADDPGWFRTELASGTADALVTAADANRLGDCTIELRGHVLRAQFRGAPNDLPDLSQTLTALVRLAKQLDGDAVPPRPDAEPLLPPPDDRAVELAGLAFDDGALACILPRARGLLARFQPPPRIQVDWGAGTVTALDAPLLPLDSILQVAVYELPRGAGVTLVDVAGAEAFSGLWAGGRVDAWDAGSLEPPLVRVSAQG